MGFLGDASCAEVREGMGVQVAWATSWWGGGGEAAPAGAAKKGKGKGIADQLDEAMTPEEKAKLYEAIDYQVRPYPSPSCFNP